MQTGHTGVGGWGLQSSASELLSLHCPLVILPNGLHGNVNSSDRFPLYLRLRKAHICIFSLSLSTRCLVIIFVQLDGVISRPSLSTLHYQHREVYGSDSGQGKVAAEAA